MKTFLRLVALAVLAGLTLTALQGCNTIRGMGKDIEKGGQKIQKATNK